MFLKGTRCYTDKCAVARRNQAPGQHGAKKKKLSEYGVQLREKQKAKVFYGVLESQFRKYVEMGMSSLFGGYLVSLVIRFSYYDYVASLGTVGIIIELIIVLVLGGFGTYYQIKHRTKF